MNQRLYRPVGLKELELILNSDSKTYPPRLDWQPIFYPVLNFDYAAQIAHDWNTKDSASDYVGYVTAFNIDATFLERYDIQNVGANGHNELWVPAEDLALFNENIQGCIQVEAAFYGADYKGDIKKTSVLKNMDVEQQLSYLKEANYDINKLVQTEKNALIANYHYWKQEPFIENIMNVLTSAYEKLLKF